MIILKILLGIIIVLVILTILLNILAFIGYIVNRYIIKDEDYYGPYADEFLFNVVIGVLSSIIGSIIILIGYQIQDWIFS